MACSYLPTSVKKTKNKNKSFQQTIHATISSNGFPKMAHCFIYHKAARAGGGGGRGRQNETVPLRMNQAGAKNISKTITFVYPQSCYPKIKKQPTTVLDV